SEELHVVAQPLHLDERSQIVVPVSLGSADKNQPYVGMRVLHQPNRFDECAMILVAIDLCGIEKEFPRQLVFAGEFRIGSWSLPHVARRDVWQDKNARFRNSVRLTQLLLPYFRINQN